MHRIVVLAIAFLFLGIGCGQSQPTIAGGKPEEYWLEKIEDENAAEREEAVKKLGNIGNKSQAAMSAVFEALSDAAPSVRKHAIFAVVRTWPASREALPILEDMKENDEDSKIRKVAEEAHGNLMKK